MPWVDYIPHVNGGIHYSDAIMGTIASQITSLTIVYSAVYSGADQIKHHNSASLDFVWGIHRGPVNSPHKWPVTRKMFPLMTSSWLLVFTSIGKLNQHRDLGAFQKHLWALKSRSSWMSTCEKNPHVSMYGLDILCGISKVPFEIPHKISYPYIERYLKRPPGHWSAIIQLKQWGLIIHPCLTSRVV